LLVIFIDQVQRVRIFKIIEKHPLVESFHLTVLMEFIEGKMLKIVVFVLKVLVGPTEPN